MGHEWLAHAGLEQMEWVGLGRDSGPGGCRFLILQFSLPLPQPKAPGEQPWTIGSLGVGAGADSLGSGQLFPDLIRGSWNGFHSLGLEQGVPLPP